MQTLKTAAIVVLLMTVMYGAYVSLTTPPEPLPANVQDMLVINEEGTLAIDASLPASLGELEINTGTVEGFDSDPILEPTIGQRNGIAAFDAQTTARELAAESNAGESGFATTLSDAPSQNASNVNARTAAALASTMGRSYPRTTNTFDLPDPDAIASEFNGNPTAANHSPTDLALTSGTSDPASLESSSAIAASPISAEQAAADPGSVNLGLANAIRAADKQYESDQRKEALATLSLFYDTPDLSGEQRSELLSRLDPLAREVIYSTRHLLEQPYRVGQDETLMEVAARFEVPWQLLANINQIKDPVAVLPGTELKIVRGPFRAEVNLSLKELTLFLGDLYAGRFPIGVGSDPLPKPGTFTVQDKQTSKTYYDASGSPVPPGSPNNPYGDAWLDLGGQLCIHGSPSTTSPTEKGCISLAADYADDLYGILSQGSSVTIRR